VPAHRLQPHRGPAGGLSGYRQPASRARAGDGSMGP
jgi:hypothetical protein